MSFPADHFDALGQLDHHLGAALNNLDTSQALAVGAQVDTISMTLANAITTIEGARRELHDVTAARLDADRANLIEHHQGASTE